ILQNIGFTARGLTGRVIFNQAIEETARTHMFVLVVVDGNKFICDVGFGGHTPTAPLLLEPNKIQKTPLEPYRLLKNERGYILQVFVKKQWSNLYAFDLQEHYLPDFKLANWYTATHPDAHFTTNL